jgi:hypothetical protein
MKLKQLSALAFCLLSLFLAPIARSQGLDYLTNTNQPVAGTVETAGFSAQFITGPNPTGYTLTACSFMFGENAGSEVTDIHIDVYSATSAGVENYIGNLYLGPAPRAPGLYFYAAQTNLFLAPNNYFDLTVQPVVDGPIDDEEFFAYTLSTNVDAAGGWSFYALDSGDDNNDPGYYPVFNIYATPLPPAVLAPIILKDVALLADGSFQFGFTNSPSFSFTTYGTTNLALPFTNWFVAGYPENTASNYFLYNTGPGVVTSPLYPRVFFRVTSP